MLAWLCRKTNCFIIARFKTPYNRVLFAVTINKFDDIAVYFSNNADMLARFKVVVILASDYLRALYRCMKNLHFLFLSNGVVMSLAIHHMI